MKKSVIVLIFCLSTFIIPRSYACTTFLISGKHTSNGKPLLFKNRDTDEMNNFLVYFTDGRYRYIGLVDGNGGWDKNVWGGYNETGFAIINSAAYTNNIGDTTKFADQEGKVMKLALQSCKTIEDFELLLNTLPRPLGVDANFGVIDAFGGAAYYETGNYSYVKYDANDPLTAPDGILVRTNHSMNKDPKKGFGFCRYNTALRVLQNARAEDIISPRFIFNHLSRNLYHSLTGTDLMARIPKDRNIPEYKFFIDYIPRSITASAVLIVGARDENHTAEAMMWTILGFPLTSVAVPCWISAGNTLPRVVAKNNTMKSPICTAALKFKEECFPITYDRGTNYLNLSAVVNRQKNGYLQLLQPVEDVIFDKSEELVKAIEKGTKTFSDIPVFYDWVDHYLSESYKKKFNIDLIDN